MAETTDHWETDRLGRKQDAKFLYNFLVGEIAKRKSRGRTASYVLNVDADWGGGKTFFIEGFAKDLENKGHLVANVNAWRDDHARDPYVALMAGIDKAFTPYIRKPGKVATAWEATKASGGKIALRTGGAVLKGLVRQYAGVSVDDLGDLIGATGAAEVAIEQAAADGVKEAGGQLDKLFDAAVEGLIESFNRTDRAMADFRLKLKKAIQALPEKKTPLFVLVDELDRCRPTYAVQLLERVKHLFDVEGVVFIFATNSEQLRHSISGAYGSNFDGFRYLKRFFDRTYVFDEPSTAGFIESLCDQLPVEKIRSPEGKLVQALETGCRAFGFDLRAIEHILEMIDAVATAWPHKIPLDLVLLFPLCAHFYQTGRAEWPSHQHEKLQKWILSRSAHDRFENKVIDRSINYALAYQIGTSMFRSLVQIAQTHRNARREIAVDYIHETFNPEWNGVHLDGDRPSVQTELQGLVANAGRLQENVPTLQATQ